MVDEIDQITEQAQVEAELARLKQAKAESQQPLPPEGSDILPAPAAEPEKREVTIDVRPEREEAKPAEPAVEVKPEERKGPPISEKEQQYASYQRKENERLKRELNDLRKLVEQQSKPVVKSEETGKPATFDDDPALFLKNEIEAAKNELAALKASQQQVTALNAIQQQEQTFMRSHPDYEDARKYMDAREESEWELSGLAVAHVNEVQQAVRLARDGDLRWKPVVDKLSEVAAREDVITKAEEQGRTPEDIAAWLIARDTYLQSQHQKVVQGAQATGRNVAEVAYQLAEKAGYKRAAEAQAGGSGDTARDKVIQAQRVAEAANSLSEANGSEASAGPKIIRNREDIIHMTDEQLDAMIDGHKYLHFYPKVN